MVNKPTLFAHIRLAGWSASSTDLGAPRSGTSGQWLAGLPARPEASKVLYLLDTLPKEERRANEKRKSLSVFQLHSRSESGLHFSLL